MNDLLWLYKDVAAEGKVHTVVIPAKVLVETPDYRALLSRLARQVIDERGPFYELHIETNVANGDTLLVFEK